jgi:hypothetical protein
MRADQAVGRRPADRESEPEAPEIALAQGDPEGHQRGVRGGRRGRVPGRRFVPHAIGGQPQGRGGIPHEQSDERHGEQQQTSCHDPADRLPAQGRDD